MAAAEPLTRLRIIRSSSLGLVLAAIVCSQNVPTFRTGVFLVHVDAEVLGGNKRPISSLAQEDFRVLDGGQEQMTVSFSQGEQQLEVMLLLDAGCSMHGKEKKMRSAIHEGLQLLKHGDRISVIVFARESRVVASSDDFVNVARTIDENPNVRSREVSRIQDAVYDATRQMISSGERIHSRRVILVLTDDIGIPSHQKTAILESLWEADTLLAFIVPKPVTAQVPNVPAGNINLFAGNYYYRNSANPIDTGVPANTVGLQAPDGLAMDSTGNLYIADKSDNLIRKVDTAGHISTVAGTGTAGSLGDGGAATSAQLNQPISVAVDAGGNLYIVDSGNHRVRKVNPTGTITAFAGNGVAPPLTGTPSDPIGDGGPATAASLDPQSVAVNASGDVYIADQTHRIIRKVDHTTSNITTVAGTLYTRGYRSTSEGGPATSALLDSPKALAIDTAGNLYIADQYGERIFKVGTTSIINTFAGTGVAATSDCV